MNRPVTAATLSPNLFFFCAASDSATSRVQLHRRPLTLFSVVKNQDKTHRRAHLWTREALQREREATNGNEGGKGQTDRHRGVRRGGSADDSDAGDPTLQVLANNRGRLLETAVV